MDPGACIGDAIKVMPDGENAGVVAETLFSEYLQRPQRLLCNREGRSPETDNPCAAYVFNRSSRSSQILPKIAWSQLVQRSVEVTVTSQFVSCPGDFPDK